METFTITTAAPAALVDRLIELINSGTERVLIETSIDSIEILTAERPQL